MASDDNEILCGMVMNVDDLDTTLKDILQELQWTQFLRMCEPVYYRRVRQFWRRASYCNGYITSEVDGTPISISQESLSHVTGYNAGGLMYTNNWYDAYTEEEISSTLTYTDDIDEVIWHDQMTTRARFLHHIVADCVCPRKRFGIRDRITKGEEFVLFHTLRRVRVDLNAIIFQYMIYTFRFNNRPGQATVPNYKETFPYGMLLSKIFMFHNLNLATQVRDRDCGPAIIFDYNIDDIFYSRLTPTSGESEPFLTIIVKRNDMVEDINLDNLDETDSSDNMDISDDSDDDSEDDSDDDSDDGSDDGSDGVWENKSIDRIRN